MAPKKLSGKKLLADLENQVRALGVSLAYEKLQFAGLKLSSGLCWFKGNYYLFVDRYTKVGARIDMLKAALEELDHLAMTGRLDNPAAEKPEPDDDPIEQALENSREPA